MKYLERFMKVSILAVSIRFKYTINMKLTKIAILALKGMGSGAKEKIAEVTGSKPGTVYGWIADNDSNSKLTLAAVVQIISEETGLNQDQILEESAKEEQNTQPFAQTYNKTG